jgi:hypothetical protein
MNASHTSCTRRRQTNGTSLARPSFHRPRHTHFMARGPHTVLSARGESSQATIGPAVTRNCGPHTALCCARMHAALTIIHAARQADSRRGRMRAAGCMGCELQAVDCETGSHHTRIATSDSTEGASRLSSRLASVSKRATSEGEHIHRRAPAWAAARALRWSNAAMARSPNSELERSWNRDKSFSDDKL